jgi:hypothetical protein
VDGCDEVAHARDAEQLEARNRANVAPSTAVTLRASDMGATSARGL